MSSDTELLQRWRVGEREAGAMLFERYYDRTERFFMNKVPDDTTEVRDLVQETFTALVQNRDRIEDATKFHPYLFSVAYKVFQAHLRRKYRHGRQAKIDLSETSVVDVAPGPSAVLCEREEQRLLLEGLRRIPVNDQTLLELFYWENIDTAEIAIIFGIPRGTVKSRLRSARARLEQAMSKIAQSDEVLQSTLSNLDSWAKRCRRLLDRDADASAHQGG